jgi:hypothetical protein
MDYGTMHPGKMDDATIRVILFTLNAPREGSDQREQIEDSDLVGKGPLFY